jgi:hypothetical protein
MKFRDYEIVPSLRKVSEGVIIQKRQAFGRDILIAEIQVFDHEGFHHGDLVRITVENPVSEGKQ